MFLIRDNVFSNKYKELINRIDSLGQQNMRKKP